MRGTHVTFHVTRLPNSLAEAVQHRSVSVGVDKARLDMAIKKLDLKVNWTMNPTWLDFLESELP